jgi:ABC-type amino acid transport substrate-binding protein
VAGELVFLSPDWVGALRAATADLPARPGTTARVSFVVTGGPDGDVAWWLAVVDGRVVDAGRLDAALVDEATGAGDEGDQPPVTVTLPRAVATAVARGEVELPAAFMQGRAKVAGDQAALVRLLAWTATPEYRAAARAVDATTRY